MHDSISFWYKIYMHELYYIMYIKTILLKPDGWSWNLFFSTDFSSIHTPPSSRDFETKTWRKCWILHFWLGENTEEGGREGERVTKRGRGWIGIRKIRSLLYGDVFFFNLESTMQEKECIQPIWLHTYHYQNFNSNIKNW